MAEAAASKPKVAKKSSTIAAAGAEIVAPPAKLLKREKDPLQ